MASGPQSMILIVNLTLKTLISVMVGTLMLLFRGIMSDIQTRIGFKFIGDAHTSRALEQRKRTDVADRSVGVRGSLNQREIEVDSKTVLLREKQEDLQGVISAYLLKQGEKWRLMREQEETGVDNSEKIAQIDKELKTIKGEMDELAAEMGALSEGIQAKGELNEADRAVLAEAEALLSISSMVQVNLGRLLGRIVQDFSESTLETGDDALAQQEAMKAYQYSSIRA